MLFSDEYSQDVGDFFWNYEDDYFSTYHRLKSSIENMPEDITPDYFREKLEPARRELLCSARRFLIDYVKNLSTEIDENSFFIEYGGKRYEFHGAGMEYSLTMPEEEREAYIELLTAIAMTNNDPDGDHIAYRKWRSLMRKAMLWTGKKNDRIPGLLSREEAFRICHGLQFDYAQAEAFMVRTQEDDGFIFTQSEDLIEAFCFICTGNNNWHTAMDLKEEYAKRTSGIEKQSMGERPENYTRSLQESLPHLIAEWEKDANHSTEELFLDWLSARADKLDVPGKSAYRNYKNLTLFAYQVLTNEDFAEGISEDELQDEILDYCARENSLPEGKTWYNILNTIFSYAINNFDNTDIKNPREYWKVYRHLALDSKGNVAVKTIGNRAINLLNGEEAITKSDLLVQLWIVCDLCWSVIREEKDTTQFYSHVSDFWILSEDLLADSMLPVFYAPHLLERTMLLSICAFDDYDFLSKHDNFENPFEIYEKLCESLTFRRASRKESKTDPDQEHNPNQTKITRKMWEQEAKEAFENGRCSWDGLETEVGRYLEEHLPEKGLELQFTKEGIILPPDPTIVIAYPDKKTGDLFDSKREDYSTEEEKEHRFKFIYTLYLYIKDSQKESCGKLKCRCNYVSKCSITVINGF